MALFFSLIAAALVVTAVSGAALTWDGSKHLFDILNNQAPTIETGGSLLVPRYSAHLLQLPVVWASHATDDLGILRTLFGLSFVSIPILALATSWYLLPDRDKGLFVWPVLSIGLATLPAQFFLVSEGLMAVQLSWPIVLAVLTQLPRTWLRWPLLIGLLLFVFCLHPVASPILAMGAMIALLLTLFHGAPRRRMLPCSVALAVLSGLQFFLTKDDPGYRGFSPEAFPVWALTGLPFASLVFTWSAGVMLLGRRLASGRGWRPLRQALRWGAWVLIVVAGSCLALWARDPLLWRGALELRRWVLPISLPLFGMAVLDQYLTTRERSSDTETDHAPATGDLLILQTVSVMFLIVLVTQSAAWFSVTLRLAHALRDSPTACIARSTITWLGGTPLYHGATPALAILLQGRRPNKLLLDEAACSDLRHGIHLADGFHLRDLDHGWFDFTAAVEATLSERR